ncbi:MAG: PQQ-binding-like beta-propeller repeat protein, partial [Planctomycetes bacterium]|nr:PQQ-binding-like beta-propeller repeat protein [Planctomycetota bacterium]
MGINVTCPRCGTTYFNLDPSLRGSKMRCPNALCRAIFEVRDDSESPPDKSGPEGAGPSPGSAPEDRKKPRPGEEHPEERKHQTGSVGDMIPILSAEQAGEVPPEETAPEPAAPRGDGDGRGGATETVAPPERPREAPSWQQPPPVRGPQTAETEAPAPAAEPSPSAGGASEVGGMVPLLSGEAVEDRIERPPAPKTPSWQEPPPVRAPQAPVEAPPPSPPAAPTPPPSSQVGGMVPLLSGEAVNLQKEPRPSAPSWQEPPPVRAPQMPGSETQVTSAPAGTAVDWRNAPPPPQTAPPVQRGDGAGVAAVPSVPLPPAAPHRRRRRTLVWTLSLLMMGALVIGGLVWMALAGKNRSEDERRQDYLGEYKAGKFDQSATDFQQLQKDFPQSQHLKEYKFLAELSAVRALATGLNRDPQAAFRGLDQFTQDHVDDPLLDPDTKGNYAEDVGKTYLQVAGDLAQQAEANLDKTLLLEVEQAVNQGAKFASKEPTKPLRDQIARIKEAMAKEARRKVVVADLQGLLDRHQKNGYDQALVRIDQAAKVDPDFPDNGQVKDILAKLYDTLRTQVTWTEGPAPGAGQSGERSEPGLLVVTPAVPSGVPLRDNDRVVFALARGVLYALKETTGDLVWATRVGIDAAVLPVRLPATNVAPESVLVVSSLARDRNYLSKRDAATGNALWTLSLSGPCLARPVVIGPRVYVPTYDGKVHAIDLAGGKVLGVFDIGQPLSAGAAYEPGANLLYVPADSRRVFVLDLKDHQNPCPAILESGHPAGSLRGAPIIVSREVLRQNFHLESAVWPDYLVLNQADSLNAMKLRVF